MQIATLSYQYDPKDSGNGNSRAKLHQRQILTTIVNPTKKSKPRRSLFSEFTHSSGPLPPIKQNTRRRNSIHIKGSSISSKIPDTSAYSLRNQSRSQSRQSNRSNVSGRSRSLSPGGPFKSTSKITRLKFGHPVKIRSSEFYAPSKTEAELRFREDAFVNDSVRAAHQSRRSSLIPTYEPLDDPHLRRFFQSPVVLDIVRQTLNIDHNSSFKNDDRLSKSSKLKKNSKINRSAEHLADDYLRIVTKGSSGYGRLNGYDCIPPYAPARNERRRSSTVDPTLSSAQRRELESRARHLTTQDKFHTSANTSLVSYATTSINQGPQENKRRSKYEKSKQPKPIATSSPLRRPSKRLPDSKANTNDSASVTGKSDSHLPEHTSELTIASNASQD